MFKKTVCMVILITFLITSMVLPVAAATQADINDKADILNQLHILKGDGSGYNLGGQLRRSEAAAFIVRIMGKEAYVLQNKMKYNAPRFKDVASDKWYTHYIGYCSSNGIIGGLSDGTYRPDDYISEKAFLKLVLGALGYKQDKDFKWGEVYQKAFSLGLVTDQAYKTRSKDNLQYKREGVVNALYNALAKSEKGSTRIVLERLQEEGAATPSQISAAALDMNRQGTKVFVTESPVSVFTKTDIDYLLAGGFTGTEEEIADKIYRWQVENMAYKAGGPGYGDVSDPMRWNYFLPGIYPTSEMIRGMRRDGKVYGICYSFAAIYCSIARYYGLECRVAAMKEKPSELDSSIDKSTTTGLSPEEYDRLKKKLDAMGLDYSYETVRQVAAETSSHYRAEVKINGQWVVKDATEAFAGNTYNSMYKFYEVDWKEGYKPDKLADVTPVMKRIWDGIRD